MLADDVDKPLGTIFGVTEHLVRLVWKKHQREAK